MTLTDWSTTIPPVVVQRSTERIPWSVDATALLGQSEMATLPVVTLIDLSTRLAYETGLVGDAELVGNVLTQVVGDLLAGHTYELIFTFTAGTNKILSMVLRIECRG